MNTMLTLRKLLIASAAVILSISWSAVSLVPAAHAEPCPVNTCEAIK